ncbi:MAG: hypothetical protein PHS54_04015 [Clostridia bacterium]|nr:hypothetical protein [Clostridia bacterium]
MIKILKNIPLISGVLIFFGYLHYSFYYSFFGIEISSYLTTGELLLSFLRLTIPILSIIAMLSLYMIGALVLMVTRDKSLNEEEKDNDAFNLFFLKELNDFISSLKRKNFRSFKAYIFVILELITLLLSLGFALFFIGYILFLFYQIVSENPKLSLINSKASIVFAVMWFFVLFSTLEKLKKKYQDHMHNFVLVFGLLGLFLSNIYIFNKETALKTLKGHPENQITIYAEDETIKTDNNLVFIGKTDNFIFLRNLQEKENEIYNISDVKKFTIKQLE